MKPFLSLRLTCLMAGLPLFLGLVAVQLFDSTEENSTLYLPDDMEATLWAEAPLFYNPTNLDIDIRGRVWVTEAVNYRDFNTKSDNRLSHSKGDRVMILEDKDGDGKAESSKIYVQDSLLTSPLGIAVIGNKVVVSCAPNLLVYTDEDGDDKPDKREVFLTGFGGYDHDHSLHSLTVGPDGRWYFNTGNAGPHTVTDNAGWTLRSGSLYTGGTPYNDQNSGNRKSDDGFVWVGGLALRINADGTGLKVMGHNFRNSYEVCLDSYGNMWQNDNDDQVITCRVSFLPENGNAGYFSADGTRFWQADRRPGQSMFEAHWHQDDPGVMPAGDNTGAGSPTGMVVYEGDAFGEKYRAMLLSCEAGRNVVFAYKPKTQGAGFKLDRRDLISSFPQASEKYEWFETDTDNRKWFRPSDIAIGPDGALYISDWYDPIVGGHAMKDKKGYGRIYRVTPKGIKLTIPLLDLTTTSGLINALQSPAVHVRSVGFEGLRIRGELVLGEVRKLLKAENPFHRARAIWLMAQLGKKGQEEVVHLLDSPNPTFRLTAFRALRAIDEHMPFVRKMANDPDAAVRREVGISLRDAPYKTVKEPLASLIRSYDGIDPWLLESIGTAAMGKEEQVYELVKNIYPGKSPQWSSQRANLTWRLHPASAISDLKIRASAASLPESERKKALTALAFIKSSDAAQAMVSLVESPIKGVSSLALWWIDHRKNNDWSDLLDWQTNEKMTLPPSYQKMLDLKEIILDKDISDDLRLKSALQMAQDAHGGNILIDLKTQGRLSPKLNEAVGKELFNNPDLNVRILASQFFPRSGKVLKMDFAARMASDPANGKRIFATYCAVCHRHGGAGADIGPDLTMIHQKFDKMTLLDAIVNPSATVVFGYDAYTFQTKKGVKYLGFLLSDGPTVVIGDIAGKRHTLPATEISSREKLSGSLMPDPGSMGLNEQDLADLTGFLLSMKVEK